MSEIVHVDAGHLTHQSLEDAFATFLRLNVAAGDASPATVRAYKSRIAQFITYCSDCETQPGMAERFFDAAVWRGLRTDNPASGVKAPRVHEEDTRCARG